MVGPDIGLRCGHLALAVLLLCAFSEPAHTQGFVPQSFRVSPSVPPTPTDVVPPDEDPILPTQIDYLRRLEVLVRFLPPEFVVKGDTAVYPPGSFGARKIVLEANSRLVLPAARGSETILIVADELIVQGRGATITWLYAGTSIDSPGPARGKALDGRAGASEGANGGDGLDGEQGSPGIRGHSAPNVELVVRVLKGSDGLTIDLRGQKGGRGGKGGTGGDGGTGAKGAPAAANPNECVRQTGPGGRGGGGGRGGPGGTGGLGGNAGRLNYVGTRTLTSSADSRAIEFLAYYGKEGAGGDRGEGGDPGANGKGGVEGDPVEPFCKLSGTRTGEENKKVVEKGPPGSAGRGGNPGIFRYSLLSPEQMQAVFGAAQSSPAGK